METRSAMLHEEDVLLDYGYQTFSPAKDEHSTTNNTRILSSTANTKYEYNFHDPNHLVSHQRGGFNTTTRHNAMNAYHGGGSSSSSSSFAVTDKLNISTEYVEIGLEIVLWASSWGIVDCVVDHFSSASLGAVADPARSSASSTTTDSTSILLQERTMNYIPVVEEELPGGEQLDLAGAQLQLQQKTQELPGDLVSNISPTSSTPASATKTNIPNENNLLPHVLLYQQNLKKYQLRFLGYFTVLLLFLALWCWGKMKSRKSSTSSGTTSMGGGRRGQGMINHGGVGQELSRGMINTSGTANAGHLLGLPNVVATKKNQIWNFFLSVLFVSSSWGCFDTLVAILAGCVEDPLATLRWYLFAAVLASVGICVHHSRHPDVIFNRIGAQIEYR
ncbi:unnamed protein product [Amoebophrya sp. A120]|nr:unnamed protein product [Amoebophrya sp. A120]|eukprot:GSA120T00019601001.1